MSRRGRRHFAGYAVDLDCIRCGARGMHSHVDLVTGLCETCIDTDTDRTTR